jgi:glutathione S-transferase
MAVPRPLPYDRPQETPVKPILYVGNQNYSSWSLRPWLVLSWGKIDFETRVIQLGGYGYGSFRIPEVVAVSPPGSVPVLHVDGEIIPDSLAISEWAAERVPSLWPADAAARAQARAAVCEMHSRFHTLRMTLPCNIRRRTEPRQLSEEVRRDVERIETIWRTLSARFGGDGPYLFGRSPTITDAFFLPIATRFRTYGVRLGSDSQRYADALLADPTFAIWEAAAKAEPFSMPQWDAA